MDTQYPARIEIKTTAQLADIAGVHPHTIKQAKAVHADGAAEVVEDGDAVALAGALTPKAWLAKDGTPKPAMDVVAHGLLTAYSVTRKRKAQAEAQQPQQARREPLDDYSERDGLGDW